MWRSNCFISVSCFIILEANIRILIKIEPSAHHKVLLSFAFLLRPRFAYNAYQFNRKSTPSAVKQI